VARSLSSSSKTSASGRAPLALSSAATNEYGGYEHHLRRLRHTLATLQKHCIQTVLRFFPAGTSVTRAEGGYLAWVQLPKRLSAVALYRAALEHKITIAPGIMFSGQGRYENCFRLNYGRVWSPRLDEALAALGRLASSLV